MRRTLIAVVLPLSLLMLFTSARAEVIEAPHVKVQYAGIAEPQANSLARTLSAARAVYVEQFKLDMPDALLLSVDCAAGRPTRLYTDGDSRVFLSLPDPAKLAPPQRSGVFNLYGMCHELGHVAMYRTLRQRPWLSGVGAEGWAHFTGSVVVDELYKTKGPELWFEPYDYRADGASRLDRALAGSPTDLDRAADCWRKLEAIIGRDGFPALFAAWDQADVASSSSSDPRPKLFDAMKATWPHHAEALAGWWTSAAPLMVEWVAASPTRPQAIARDKLTGRPLTLRHDDDAPDGKRSIAGGGHAVAFDAPDAASAWYLTAVHVNGARYGPGKAPGTLFTIALCDSEMRPIQSWRKPYAAFERGGETRWVRFELPPTRVPQQFVVCVAFAPTATNGVYVASDNSTHGHSRVATPGKAGTPLEAADWMIRIDLDVERAGAAPPPATQDR